MRVFSETDGAIPSEEKGRRHRSFSYTGNPRKRGVGKSVPEKRNTDEVNLEKSKKFRIHPLFLLVGAWYACTGKLFLFLLGALVALQHELAHAYAAAKLGYRLNSVVLMPFGAVIDGDLKDISLKDEIFVAFCGPLCNLVTAVFFAALWWFAPTMYAFTDTACYSSLAIALVNLLPAYPLDGGRIFKCALTRVFAKTHADINAAERKAEKLCRVVTVVFSLFFLAVFLRQCLTKRPNLTLLFFGVFLLASGFGNRDKAAVYSRLSFAQPRSLKKGTEIRRVAISANCPVKDAFRFLSRGSYLVLELYDERENHLCDLTQNELSVLFEKAENPYTPLVFLVKTVKNTQIR